MSTGRHDASHHPKWYRPPISIWWWLKKRSYAAFMLRELTSVFVAFFAVVLLWQVRSLAEGPEAYARVMARLQTPLFLALDVLAFLMILFHMVTWFNVAPAAMVVRVRGKRIPDWALAGSHYAAWVLLSIVVAAILLRG
jgi:fumarate reductase subunit C